MYTDTFALIENDRTRNAGQPGHVPRAAGAADGFVSRDEDSVADRPVHAPGRRRNHTESLVRRSLPDPHFVRRGYAG